MSNQEQKRERAAGWVVGGWLVLHQFLLADPGRLAPLAVFLLCTGILLRLFRVFPPAPAGWLLLVGAVVVALVARHLSGRPAQRWCHLVGDDLDLRPLLAFLVLPRALVKSSRHHDARAAR